MSTVDTEYVAAEVLADITSEGNPVLASVSIGVRRCGCQEFPGKWWLCQYHEGMQRGIEIARPV